MQDGMTYPGITFAASKSLNHLAIQGESSAIKISLLHILKASALASLKIACKAVDLDLPERCLNPLGSTGRDCWIDITSVLPLSPEKTALLKRLGLSAKEMKETPAKSSAPQFDFACACACPCSAYLSATEERSTPAYCCICGAPAAKDEDTSKTAGSAQPHIPKPTPKFRITATDQVETRPPALGKLIGGLEMKKGLPQIVSAADKYEGLCGLYSDFLTQRWAFPVIQSR